MRHLRKIPALLQLQALPLLLLLRLSYVPTLLALQSSLVSFPKTADARRYYSTSYRLLTLEKRQAQEQPTEEETTISSYDYSKTPITGSSAAICSQKPSPYSVQAKYFQMLSFYTFRSMEDVDIDTLRDKAFSEFYNEISGLRGTLYIADEGVNGQFAVPSDQLTAFQNICENLLDITDLNIGDRVPLDTPTFEKLIVRTRNAILRDGIKLTLDWNNAGEELPPSKWHQELENNPQALILDCRNDYESDQGTFQNAIPLNTTTFSESWEKLDAYIMAHNNHNDDAKKKNSEDPVYIFCTGGIRCVKVGAYLKQKLGINHVKRLEHGIIGYQKWQSESSDRPSLWEGENFLFDQRRFRDHVDNNGGYTCM